MFVSAVRTLYRNIWCSHYYEPPVFCAHRNTRITSTKNCDPDITVLCTCEGKQRDDPHRQHFDLRSKNSPQLLVSMPMFRHNCAPSNTWRHISCFMVSPKEVCWWHSLSHWPSCARDLQFVSLSSIASKQRYRLWLHCLWTSRHKLAKPLNDTQIEQFETDLPNRNTRNDDLNHTQRLHCDICLSLYQSYVLAEYRIDWMIYRYLRVPSQERGRKREKWS